MGGLVAVELARKLKQMGRLVDPVMLFDTRAPGRVPESASADERLEVLGHLVRVMYRSQSLEVPISEADLEPLDNRQRLERVSEALMVLPGCSEFTPEGLEAVAETYEAHVKAARRFEGAHYDGTVTLFRPRADMVDADDFQSIQYRESCFNRF